MKPARNWFILAAAFVVVSGLAVLFLFQHRSAEAARVAEIEARRLAEEARAAAMSVAQRAVEAPPTTAVESIEAKSAADSQRKEAGAQLLELQIIDPEGAAVADAKVVLFRDEVLVGEGTTGSDGLARWPAQEGTAKYAIAAWEFALAFGEVELAAGRRIVTLREGATISGTATVDGAVPAAPFELRWRPDAPVDGAGVPAALWKTLKSPAGRFALATARTSRDGSFQFRGMPDVKGSLHWSAPYLLRGVWSENQARMLKLDAPQSAVLLDLVAGCELRLRVVDSQSRPVPQARVKLERKLNAGDRAANQGTSRGGTDADGRCSIALGPQPFERCIVSVAPAQTEAWKDYQFTPPPNLRGVWDVGDLAAMASRAISVRVQDVEGKPIEGAGVYVWPTGRQQAHPKTDRTGILPIVLGASESQVGVEAFTYTSTIVAIPEDATEVTATLERTCALEFMLSDPARDRDGLTLELNGPTPLFDEDARMRHGSEQDRPLTATVENSAWSSGGGGDGTTSLMIRPEKDLRWRVAALVPGQTMRARLHGGGALLCEVEVPPLAPSEQRVVTFPNLPTTRSLVVRVLSPEMKPDRSAKIWTEEGGENLRSSTAQSLDAQGEREFKWLSGERFDFFVSSDVNAPKNVSLRPIPSGRFDVVLDPAQSVEVELVNRDGTPYTIDVSFNTDILLLRPRVTRIPPNVHRVEGLPAGDVLLTVQGRFGLLSRFYHPGDPRMRLVVDEVGSIEATVRGIGNNGRSLAIEIAIPGSTSGLLRSPLRPGNEGSSRVSIKCLPTGEYQLWFVRSEDLFLGHFERVGTPAKVVIDAQHTSVKLDLTAPR